MEKMRFRHGEHRSDMHRRRGITRRGKRSIKNLVVHVRHDLVSLAIGGLGFRRIQVIEVSHPQAANSYTSVAPQET